MAIVFSGIIPIMISMKQRNFYILTVYPFFAIAVSWYLYPILKSAIDKISTDSIGFKVFKGVTLAIVVLSIALSVMQIDRVGREQKTISDARTIIDYVGTHKNINICPSLASEWSLHGYFARYGHISLEVKQQREYQYYIATGNCRKQYLEKNYIEVPIKTQKYRLYKKKY